MLGRRIQAPSKTGVPGDGLESERGSPRIMARAAAATRDPRFREGALVSPEPVRVVVLYSHPLMGEGLERMLAAEPGIVVHAVDISDPAAVDEALIDEPAVIIVEEGGLVDAADIVRRSSCAVVLDVDINTTRAWALRRESLSSRPDEFLAEIRAAVGRGAQDSRGARDAGADADGRPETDLRPVSDPRRQHAVLPN